MKISIFGTGYVGLVAGACLADVGHDVICVDVDPKRVDNLKAGIIPIYEPGLEALVKNNAGLGRLNFSLDAEHAVQHAQVIFIAVGTPPDEDGSADLKYVLKVAETIGQYMNDYKVVINKSTVPVGTADKVKARVASVLADRAEKIEFDVCSNPEFLKEGAAIEDFTRGARIVVGTDSERVQSLMRECYAPYNRNHDKIIFMDVRSAELTKYAANAMLATKISFMNEISNLAEKLGADVEHVRIGIGSDPRIGYHFIYAGAGYGGSCFPKDVQALARTAEQVGYTPQLLHAVEGVNAFQKESLFTKLVSALGSVSGKTIAVWGLAFKPETDDMREAPSRVLIDAVLAAGGKVVAYDPKAMDEAKRIYAGSQGISFVESRNATVDGADALVICTEWKEFRTVDFEWLATQLKSPVVVDGRNLFNPEYLKRVGLEYWAYGRGNSVNSVS